VELATEPEEEEEEKIDQFGIPSQSRWGSKAGCKRDRAWVRENEV